MTEVLSLHTMAEVLTRLSRCSLARSLRATMEEDLISSSRGGGDRSGGGGGPRGGDPGRGGV